MSQFWLTSEPDSVVRCDVITYFMGSQHTVAPLATKLVTNAWATGERRVE